MAGDGKVLLVLEDGALREECVRLAFELAKRLGCAVDALLLTGSDGGIPADVAEDVLAGVEGAARAEGIGLSREAKAGDPGSELLKHMATHGAARVVVWGGADSALSSSRHARKGIHWFVRVREQLHCPILTASSRVKHRQAAGRAGPPMSTSRKT